MLNTSEKRYFGGQIFQRRDGYCSISHVLATTTSILRPKNELAKYLCSFYERLRLRHLYHSREETDLRFEIKDPSLANIMGNRTRGVCRILLHTITCDISKSANIQTLITASSFWRHRGLEIGCLFHSRLGKRRGWNNYISHRTDALVNCLPDTLNWKFI